MRTLHRRQILAFACGFTAQHFCGWPKSLFASTRKKNFTPVRFGVLSDSHVDLNGSNGWLLGKESLLCLSATVQALNKEQLDFVLVLGDLLYDGGYKDLLEAKKTLDSLISPYFIVAGNHDFQQIEQPGSVDKRRYLSADEFVAAFNGHGYNGSGKRCWAQDIGQGLRLIGLDSCRSNGESDYGGALDHQQIQWLRRQLANNTDSLHIIMLHHNLVHWGNDALSEKGRWFSLDNNKEIRQLLESYADTIGVVLSGHRHIGLRRRRLNAIDYIVVPSINSYPMRYTLFQISGNELCWQTRDVPVNKQLHELAKAGLLEGSWAATLNKMNEKEIITFYTNTQQIRGSYQL